MEGIPDLLQFHCGGILEVLFSNDRDFQYLKKNLQELPAAKGIALKNRMDVLKAIVHLTREKKLAGLEF